MNLCVPMLNMSQKQPENIEKDVAQLREWIVEQKLPQDLGDRQLLRFLHSCYYEEKKAKSVIELFFKIRTASPDLLMDRDPLSPEMQNTLKTACTALLRTSENHNIWIWSISKEGLKYYNYVIGVKLFILQLDAWLLEDDNLEEADIIIMDVNEISLKMLKSFSLSVASRFNKYQQEAIPIRLKQVHMLNVSPIFYKIFSFIKPFLNKEIKEKLNFHLPQSGTIFNFLKKKDLPEEFGGTNGKMAEHTKVIIDSIVRNRESLIRTDLWNAGDWKSSSKESVVNQSIQKLEID